MKLTSPQLKWRHCPPIFPNQLWSRPSIIQFLSASTTYPSMSFRSNLPNSIILTPTAFTISVPGSSTPSHFTKSTADSKMGAKSTHLPKQKVSYIQFLINSITEDFTPVPILTKYHHIHLGRPLEQWGFLSGFWRHEPLSWHSRWLYLWQCLLEW